MGEYPASHVLDVFSRCHKTKAILRGFEFYVLFMYAGQLHFDRVGILVVIQRRVRDDADSFFFIH